MSTTEIIIIVAATAVGAVVQGSTGLGLAMVAGPLLVSVDSGFAPGPILVAAQVIGIRHILAEGKESDREVLTRAFFGLPFGLFGGLAVLVAVSDRTLAILVGSMTAVAAAALLSGIEIRPGKAADVTAGAACTFASVTAGLPGPALAIGFAGMRPATMRSTASKFGLLYTSPSPRDS